MPTLAIIAATSPFCHDNKIKDDFHHLSRWRPCCHASSGTYQDMKIRWKKEMSANLITLWMPEDGGRGKGLLGELQDTAVVFTARYVAAYNPPPAASSTPNLSNHSRHVHPQATTVPRNCPWCQSWDHWINNGHHRHQRRNTWLQWLLIWHMTNWQPQALEIMMSLWLLHNYLCSQDCLRHRHMVFSSLLDTQCPNYLGPYYWTKSCPVAS